MTYLCAVLRFMLLLAIFLAGLCLASGAIGRVDPFGKIPMVSAKWNYWQRHKEEFDTLFIGTSRVYRGVIPKRFDELTAAAGIPTRSFNFGIAGMHAPEDGFMAEQILAHPPKSLKRVFLEANVYLGTFADQEPNSLRMIYWHDWKRTALCVRSILWSKGKKTRWKQWFQQKGNDPTRFALALAHLRPFLFRTFNLGRGAAAWNELALHIERPERDVLGPHSDGFLSKKDSTQDSAALIADYMARYTALQRQPAKIIPMNRFCDESLRGSVARVRAIGAKPYVLIPPTVVPERGRPSEPEATLPVFDFCDLEAYPELFSPEHRIDFSHLNAAGAEHFTQRLAEKFIAHTRTPSSTPR